MSRVLNEKVEQFKRQQLQELLNLLTKKQNDMFNVIFKNGVSNENIDSAYDLCERTLNKNEQ